MAGTWGRAGRVAAILAAVLAALAAAGLAALTLGLKPLALGLLSRGLNAQVRLDGPLQAGAGPDGVDLRFKGLHLRARGAPGDFASVADGEVELAWSTLLGPLHARRLRLGGLVLDLVRDDAGRANWPAPAGGGASRPPRIDRLMIQEGVVRLRDIPGRRTFAGALSTTAGAGAELKLGGRGASDGGPWTLQLQSPATLRGGAPRPISLRLGVEGPTGPSRLAFDGSLLPGPGRRVTGVVRASGPDLHALSPPTGLPLPRTPAYALATRVAAADGLVRLDGLGGRVGESELTGELALRPGRLRRQLQGRFHARRLRMSDLLDVASSGQLTRARPTGRLLPDGPIKAAPLRKLYGAVRLDADATTTPAIRSLRLAVAFDGGRITADPLLLRLSEGQADQRFVLDVRGAVPVVTLDSTVRGASTGELTPARGPPPRAYARFDADLRLSGRGESLAQAAAHASGSISLRSREGRLGALAASALSADLLRGLMAALDRSRPTVALRCARAQFAVRDGLAEATRLSLATDAGTVRGTGRLDLRQETLDLTLRPQGAARGASSVRLQGPLTRPRVSLLPGGPAPLVGAAMKALAAAPGALLHGGPPRVATADCS